jgi:hypothetical protein
VRGEARVVGELRLLDRGAEAAEDVVGVGGDHDPLAVGRLEDVRRRDALEPGPAGPAHDPEPVVLRDHALEQREARLHERDVDDLAAAAERVAPVEGREDPLDGVHAGERVAERDVDPRRRLTGKPLMWRMPPIASAADAKPARAAYGPVCP